MSEADSSGALWLAILSLAEQATRDALTGLYNRRYFDETLADHVAAAQRYERGLSLVLFDIDDFKHINDAQGHPAGDAVLRQFADLLRSTARQADIVCRIGGDEFAAILPETKNKAAQSFVDRIRQALQTLDGELFASAGIASLPCHGPSRMRGNDLVAKADADLRSRKEASRR